MLAVVLALSMGGGQAPPVSMAPLSLEVPYLSQTEALCGGAAAAMVFRYWGDRHADAAPFAPLVDRRAGGIAQDVLARAIVEGGRWQATAIAGSPEVVQDHLGAGRPLILLIEDRPSRYHYVVAVGAGHDHLTLHDPAWGPSRRYTMADLLRRWKPTNYWALLVLPRPDVSVASAVDVATPTAAKPAVGLTACDRALAEAVAQIKVRDLEFADAALGQVQAMCPDAPEVVSELAGVRLAQRRFAEADSLARVALDRNPELEYAWDVLGSARFIQNDAAGALRAWNQIERPRINLVRITGLERTRHALLAEAVGLSPNAVLTYDQYRLADRRLQALPDRTSASLTYRPEANGYATVDIAIAERPRVPSGITQWSFAAARAAVNRELRATLPGWTGGGEVWTMSWRWWEDRERLRLSLAAPSGWLPGVWRVEGQWEEQLYATGSAQSDVVRESRLHAGLGLSSWITPDLRYELQAGADSWDGARRTLSVGGIIERRAFDDRLAISASLHQWIALSSAAHFGSGLARFSLRSRTVPQGFVHALHLSAQTVTSGAPLSLWPGAGHGQARASLLRAHGLLRDNIVRSPAVGRQLLGINVESVRWLKKPEVIPLGVAAFADVARAWRRLTPAEGDALQIDAGIGLRVRLPGEDRVLRIDAARGLRDGRNAISVGWVTAF